MRWHARGSALVFLVFFEHRNSFCWFVCEPVLSAFERVSCFGPFRSFLFFSDLFFCSLLLPFLLLLRNVKIETKMGYGDQVARRDEETAFFIILVAFFVNLLR